MQILQILRKAALGALLALTMSAAGQETQATGQTQEVSTPGGTLPNDPSIALVKVAEGLVDPVNVASPDDGSGRLFIVERVGRLRIVAEDGTLIETPFLDLREEVKTDFLEQGLLGLAFHPDYAENGLFYVYYTDWRTNGDTFVVEYSVSGDDANLADPESARLLLTLDQPYVNHNGGTINFGPDGYLYVALGDGGLAGDPYETAQNLNDLLGSLLRIDVDQQHGPLGYGVPDDNPFAEAGVIPSARANPAAQEGGYYPGARPEIWAYGLRNPWQFSFDSETGDLYIADVGQGLWEEINFQSADSQGGENYGWDHMEGAHCYPSTEGDCALFGVLPVAEYNHDQGDCSITGIGVYRGEASPDLDGIYFNSDYCSGRVWGLAHDEGGTWAYQELLNTTLLVTGAGSDEAGELYLTSCDCVFGRDYDPYESSNGVVWRIVAADAVPEDAETAPLEGAEGEADEEETEDEGQTEQEQQEEQGEGQNDQAMTVGSELYSQNCAVCHGGNGGGGQGPALAGNQALQDADLVARQIVHGLGAMPAFGPQLSDEQIAEVASYIRTSWGNTFGEVSTEQVEGQR